MTLYLLSFGAKAASLTQTSGLTKHGCPHRNTELLGIENAGLSAVQSRNGRDRGSVEDVVLGDFDLVEGECTHRLDQDHHPGDDVRRPIGVQTGDLCPFGQWCRGQLREKSLYRDKG